MGLFDDQPAGTCMDAEPCDECKQHLPCIGSGHGRVVVRTSARPWSPGATQPQFVLTAIVDDEPEQPGLRHPKSQSTTNPAIVGFVTAILIALLFGVVWLFVALA
jgi:hypothetical protein